MLHFLHLLLLIYLYDLDHFQLTQWTRQDVYPNVGRASFISKRSESFKPKRHSGAPERYALIIICPETSARNDVPTINLNLWVVYLLQTLISLHFRLRRRMLRFDGILYRFCGTTWRL